MLQPPASSFVVLRATLLRRIRWSCFMHHQHSRATHMHDDRLAFGGYSTWDPRCLLYNISSSIVSLYCMVGWGGCDGVVAGKGYVVICIWWICATGRLRRCGLLYAKKIILPIFNPPSITQILVLDIMFLGSTDSYPSVERVGQNPFTSHITIQYIYFTCYSTAETGKHAV